MARTWMLLGALLAASSAWADPSDPYRVGSRDVLHVEVYGEPDCTRDVTVSDSGVVTLPHIGDVQVGGLTIESVVDEIRARYLDGILLDPQIAVTVQSYRSQPFQVVGAVRNPGTFFIERPMTVRDAVSQAGWIETEKSSRQVSLRRADGERVVFPTDGLAGTPGDLAVHPGDVISVDEGQWVYVSGEVEKEGEILYYDGLTAWRAVIQAGGPAETARLRRAYLVREDGERILVNLKRIRDGEDPDVLMEPGDRLTVHESPL